MPLVRSHDSPCLLCPAQPSLDQNKSHPTRPAYLSRLIPISAQPSPNLPTSLIPHLCIQPCHIASQVEPDVDAPWTVKLEVDEDDQYRQHVWKGLTPPYLPRLRGRGAQPPRRGKVGRLRGGVPRGERA